MYKHECVQCSKENKHMCALQVSFFNRFFGTKEILECPIYQRRIEKAKKVYKK